LPSERILITGVSTYWGGRLAQQLEADDAVETVIGIDRNPPKVELQRAEFVQVADSPRSTRWSTRGWWWIPS
jgi:UDP-glucose 4-epimerase